MKPFDLYQHFHNFCEMLDNKDLSIETRMALGKEWVRSLPAPMLCAPYELSRTLVEDAMVGRLKDKESEYGRGTSEASQEAKDLPGPLPVQQQAGARPEPVRQDARDGRGKVVVEDLDRPKVPKAKRQGSGKA